MYKYDIYKNYSMPRGIVTIYFIVQRVLTDSRKIALINAGKAHNIATYEERKTKHVQDIRYR